MKKRFSKQNLIMQVWGSILLSIVLSVAMPLISHGSLGLNEFLSGFIFSFFVSLLIKLLIPVIEFAHAAAAKLGAERQTVQHRIVSTIILALLLGTTMSLIMTWWGIHGLPDYQTFFIESWLKVYPWVLMIVFVMINVSISTGALLVRKDDAQADK